MKPYMESWIIIHVHQGLSQLAYVQRRVKIMRLFQAFTNNSEAFTDHFVQKKQQKSALKRRVEQYWRGAGKQNRGWVPKIGGHPAPFPALAKSLIHVLTSSDHRSFCQYYTWTRLITLTTYHSVSAQINNEQVITDRESYSTKQYSSSLTHWSEGEWVTWRRRLSSYIWWAPLSWKWWKHMNSKYYMVWYM